jgi:hypothetical protein
MGRPDYGVFCPWKKTMIQLVTHYEKNIWLQRKTPFCLHGNQINTSRTNTGRLNLLSIAMCLIVFVAKKADLWGS